MPQPKKCECPVGFLKTDCEYFDKHIKDLSGGTFTKPTPQNEKSNQPKPEVACGKCLRTGLNLRTIGNDGLLYCEECISGEDTKPKPEVKCVLPFHNKQDDGHEHHCHFVYPSTASTEVKCEKIPCSCPKGGQYEDGRICEKCGGSEWFNPPNQSNLERLIEKCGDYFGAAIKTENGWKVGNVDFEETLPGSMPIGTGKTFTEAVENLIKALNKQ